MTMRGRDLSEMPADTAAIGQRLMSQDNAYRVIGDHLAEILQDQQFADMYEDTGREAVWPALLAMVTIFQFQEKVPDREAADMAVMRLDWKYALRLPLSYAGFHYSVLCEFRQRILEHGKEALVFDAILNKVRSLGFIKKRGKQRTDSLAVVGAVRQLSALETVSETLRVTLRAMMKADPAWAEKTVSPSFRERYLESRPDYKLTAEERKEEMLKTGQDGFWLLEQVGASGTEAIKALEELRTMQTVWEQRYHRVEGKVVLGGNGVDAKDRIVTPHDVGVRVGQKRGKTWHGDKVHVSETTQAEEQDFITDMTRGNAAGGDVEALPEIQDRLEEREVPPGEQYTDSGYISGKQIAESAKRGITLIGPPLADTSPNELKISDFTIDREAREATCPAGQKSVKWSARIDRDGSAAVNIRFSAEACAACPLRTQCTTGESGRSLHLNEHYELLEARRAEARTEEFWEKMRARPGIEATLSELVRGYGLRRHRYRGDGKRRLENLLKGAACNLRRLTRALVARWEKEKTALAGGNGVQAAATS